MESLSDHSLLVLLARVRPTPRRGFGNQQAIELIRSFEKAGPPFSDLNSIRELNFSQATPILAFSGWIDRGSISPGTVKRFVENDTQLSTTIADLANPYNNQLIGLVPAPPPRELVGPEKFRFWRDEHMSRARFPVTTHSEPEIDFLSAIQNHPYDRKRCRIEKKISSLSL